MKKNFKMFVLGLLTGVVLVSAPVMANDLWEKIDVVRNKIAVMVNGQKLDADNFLYNDTTYVPIRAVAESLGVNVEYKDGVAYIGKIRSKRKPLDIVAHRIKTVVNTCGLKSISAVFFGHFKRRIAKQLNCM